MTEDLKWNLQLFADEGTTDTEEVEDTEEGTDTTPDSVSNGYGIDEEGNLVILDGDKVIANSKNANNNYGTTNEEEPDTEKETEDETKDPETDTPSEDKKFTAKVDGKDVEVTLEELLNGYQRQSDYTKKTQALAQEKAALAKQQAPAPEPVAPPEKATPKQFYENLTNVAKEAVVADMGEDFDEFNPIHMAALSLKVNQITAGLQSNADKQNSVQKFEVEARSKEPENYDAIYEHAKGKVDYLPYKDRIALEQAFNEGDINIINAFFETMRKDYYNSNGKTVPGEVTKPIPKAVKKTVKPPLVEKGSGEETKSKSKMRDARELSKLSIDDKSKWLIDMGIV